MDIPFEVRISPDVAAANARHMKWLRAEGFVTTSSNADRYLTWAVGELAGRFHPDAFGDDLELGIQGQTFYFFFDDLFDSHLGRDPLAAYGLCQEMAALARQSPDSSLVKPTFPLARLWLDHWERLRHGMSVAWRERAARHWEQYFLSYVTEAVNRRAGLVLDMSRYLALRRVAIGVEGVLDTAERCGGFEAPPEVHESTLVQEIREITAEVVILTNDLHSLEKDEANGEPDNAVLLLRREHDCSQEDAIGLLRGMVHQRIDRFRRLTDRTHELCAALGLSPRQRESTHRFLGANRALMRGNYDWSRATDRYSRIGVDHVQRSPRIEDIITAHTEA
ncbi:terpene synthase family protein [Streptomyces hesseae]|uniref:Terpene synthase n=1 Tax=Streptomyces hesseae TaxID=3075519 RepID=A0ABU2SP94_9ACTN|nr:pentalenene synthase [Streptomyces sp. DSM 40473]MDT0449610.1 pentalenene synthase [Streptomyces sp. DSM 40473]